MTAEEIVERLELTPLPQEGGYFRETYRAPAPPDATRDLATAIYYLITPDAFSHWHRLPIDEIWHFYLGDPVEQGRIRPDGSAESHLLGSRIVDGHLPQTVVPADTWQASRLVPGGAWALLGTTMAPAFTFADLEMGDPAQLAGRYPQHHALIRHFDHP